LIRSAGKGTKWKIDIKKEIEKERKNDNAVKQREKS
jgi:hypothetical protein